MKLTELVNRGWTAMLRFDPSLPSGKETMLATRMPGWSAMSWAEQVSSPGGLRVRRHRRVGHCR